MAGGWHLSVPYGTIIWSERAKNRFSGRRQAPLTCTSTVLVFCQGQTFLLEGITWEILIDRITSTVT